MYVIERVAPIFQPLRNAPLSGWDAPFGAKSVVGSVSRRFCRAPLRIWTGGIGQEAKSEGAPQSSIGTPPLVLLGSEPRKP